MPVETTRGTVVNVWDLFKLDGKVSFVTGGAHGLGYYMALALAEAGSDVAISSRSGKDAGESARKIAEATGRRVIGLELVLPSEEQVEGAVQHVLGHFGRIDVLVNNAGNVRSTPQTAPFERRSLKLWQETIDLNLTGLFLCSKHVVAKAMLPAGSGNIINLGSTTGIVGKDRRVYEGTGIGGATLDYHAAKGGVISMTRDMAVYLAPNGIRVNCISPGGFLRDQSEKFVAAYSSTFPMNRMGREDKELKGAVVFLASEASSFVTGHNLVVDGGLTIW